MKSLRYLIFNCLIVLAVQVNAQSFTGSPIAIEVNIDLDKTHQTMENFGASDAWAGQYVGLWPQDKKNAIADLLFSLKTDADGKPKGIGLSLWRFNFGAGSTQQGEESGVKTEWRRAESFYNADGTYDWGRQEGQQWFLKAAKERGVKQFLGFFNSPPVQFTKNHLSMSSDGESNISSDQYQGFSNYITDAIKGVYKNSGVLFNYISPVNEPQWDWKDNKQEGNPYTNQEVLDLVKVINHDFEQQKIDTKIIIPEAAKINYLLSTADKPERGEQIEAFFSGAIKGLSHVENVVAGHSYFTTSPYPKAVKLRQQLKDKVEAVEGLRFWMSEYCILGDNEGEIKGNGKDLGITSALYIAKVIHNDLVNANATAWHWWTAISPYNYKDGLVYIDDHKQNGNFTDSKMLWALGNYSRFIRPGFIRIDATYQSSLSDSLLVSAYKNPLGKEMVCVVINSSDQDVKLNLQLNHKILKDLKQYNTSEMEDLKPHDILNSKLIKVPAKSVITITGN